MRRVSYPVFDVDLNDETQIFYQRLTCWIKDENERNALMKSILELYSPPLVTAKSMNIIIHCSEEIAARIIPHFRDYHFESRALYISDKEQDCSSTPPPTTETPTQPQEPPVFLSQPSSDYSSSPSSSSSSATSASSVKAEKVIKENRETMSKKLEEFRNDVKILKDAGKPFPFKIIETFPEIQSTMKDLYIPKGVTVPDEVLFTYSPYFLLCDVCAKLKTKKISAFVYNTDKEKCIRGAKSHWSKHHNPDKKPRKKTSEQLAAALEEMAKTVQFLQQQQLQQQLQQQQQQNPTQSSQTPPQQQFNFTNPIPTAPSASQILFPNMPQQTQQQPQQQHQQKYTFSQQASSTQQSTPPFSQNYVPTTSSQTLFSTQPSQFSTSNNNAKQEEHDSSVHFMGENEPLHKRKRI